MRRRRRRLTLRQAAALGLVQGPAELLPVSSSGHLVLVPALLDWPYTRLPADVRKAFEVALHAGTAAALVLVWRRDLAEALRRPAETALLAAPAAAAGVTLERVLEERMSRPEVAAAAQIAGGVLLAASQRRLEVPETRSAAIRYLVPGAAQAFALVPGVSRNGAALTGAAMAGFDRAEAAAISRRAALAVIGGAAALKAYRLARGGLRAELRGPFAVGAAAAFASTLAAAPLGRLPARRSWLPWAAWRVALGAVALRRLQPLQ